MAAGEHSGHPAEQVGTVLDGERTRGVDDDLVQAAAGMVDLLKAVHQRAPLDRDAAAHRVYARIGPGESGLHVELKHGALTRLPGPGQAHPAIFEHSHVAVWDLI